MSILLGVKRLAGPHSAYSTLTRGFWARRITAAAEDLSAGLQCSSKEVDELWKCDEARQRTMSNASPSLASDAHACSASSARAVESDGPDIRHHLSFLPHALQPHSSPVSEAFRGVPDQKGSRGNRYISRWSLNLPALRPHIVLGELSSARSFSSGSWNGNLEGRVSQANSVLQVGFICPLHIYLHPQGERQYCFNWYLAMCHDFTWLSSVLGNLQQYCSSSR